jgi:AmmeMemoRadiSam system protein A
MSAVPAPLTSAERLLLLDLARRAVLARAEGRPGPEPPRSPRLLERQGAFVTLRVRGDLRGCIGIVEPIRPLAETVAHCASAAAAEDPRFPPLGAEEAREVVIEITALAPPVPVGSLGQIEIGRHGLVASRGSRRGVLLPQVAVEQEWDVPIFVAETLRKAGLPPDALERGGATLEAFEAEVFSEETTAESPGSPPRSHAPR